MDVGGFITVLGAASCVLLIAAVAWALHEIRREERQESALMRCGYSGSDHEASQ